MPTITFADGTKKIYRNNISILEILNTPSLKLSKTCIAAEVNDILVDIYTIIKKNVTIKFIDINDDNILSLQIIRNTCIQLFSYAVKVLWPSAKLSNNKITDNGFYYDINQKLQITDLKVIEKKMHELVNKNYVITKKILNYNSCLKLFEQQLEDYKYYILKTSKLNEKNEITIYYHENHVDITPGPQAPNIKFCNHFKIQQISGVYWLNKPTNKILQRIYVTVWNSNKQLKSFLKQIYISTKRDHRKIAKQLDLYHIQEESPGMVFWHKNGWIIFKELQKFIQKKLDNYNYQEVKSPIILNKTMWKKSGHWTNYKDSIFITSSEKRDYCIKPMSCPAHIQIFNQKLRSYKELPIRIAEFGSCHRNEPSGSLHGLMRIRAFTQDDGHIFCTKNQIRSEINHCIKMIFNIYKIFGFKNINIKFSSRPKERIGNDETWDQAENDLINVLQENKLQFTHQKGEGAFYGPKIELILKDCLNRTWQCGTIQLDFYLPKRLQSFYVDKDNNRKHPILIHRAILGSIERFIGILIEEYSGSFPLWLSPIQVIIIGIAKNHIEYVQSLFNILHQSNIRVKKDIRNISLSAKIKESINFHVPYTLICGDNELNSSTITIRIRNGRIIKNVQLNYFIQDIQYKIKTYNLHLMEE